MSAFARSSRICGWAGRELVCFWSMSHTWSVVLTWREGQASPYILSFRTQCTHWQNKPGTEGRFRPQPQSPGPQHQFKGTKCLIDLISLEVPGQIFFKDGVQVCRTTIGDPTLTSNDAPHNLSCFWAQQSLNRSFYHHTFLQPLSKERNWPHQ